MRILTFKAGEITNPGGINDTVRQISNQLSKRNHQCTVVTTNTMGLPKNEFYSGFEVIRINPNAENKLYGLNFGFYGFCKEKLADINPDIIHVHGYHGFFALEVIYTIKMMNYQVPIVFSPYLDTFRSSLAGKYMWDVFNFFGKKVFDYSSIILACSEYESNNIKKCTNDKNSNKIQVIPLGVDLSIDQSKKRLKRKPIKLIYSGFLVRRKGVHFILKSLHALIKDFGFNDVLLTIVGNGPEKRNLLKLSEKLGIENHIIWKSFLEREEFINEILMADMFILLSESEAYGITIAEALTIGTPCIVTNNTALSEFSDENGCFFVEYPPDPVEVANLILEVFNNEVQVGPFTDKIRSWDKIALDYERIYRKVLNEE